MIEVVSHCFEISSSLTRSGVHQFHFFYFGPVAGMATIIELFTAHGSQGDQGSAQAQNGMDMEARNVKIDVSDW